MTDIVAIQEQILATTSVLARMDREAASAPGDPLFLLNYRSIEKRLETLGGRLLEAAGENGLEVCSYRISSEGGSERIPISGVADALGDFQLLLGVVSDALRGGPRSTLSVTKASARASELSFSYAMAGSAVFIMTVPSGKDITDESHIRDAVDAVFGATAAKKADDVRAFAKRVGTGPVRAMARWAKHHVEHQLGAEVVWLPSDDNPERRVTLSGTDLQRLTNVISSTSEETVEEETYDGTLVAADASNDTFRFSPDGDRPDIRGHAGGLIGQQSTVEVPRRYAARVRKISRVSYSTDQEQVRYILLDLNRI